ncbi:hypothetical protein BC628DRAFT_1415820 [Trametes gibbosa]|nr:hypothetical protein BC628DRAFT_1415820 [Trametes gibbosa]
MAAVHFGFADSADTQLIQFIEPSPAPSGGPAWFFNQSGTLLGAVYKSTLTGCNASGASVVFKFNGSNISVFGSVVDSQGGDPPASVFRVDEGSPTTFTATQTVGRSDDVLFFSSPPLPLGNHTLTINITHASASAPFYLDYMQYSIDVLQTGTSSTLSPSMVISATESSSGMSSLAATPGSSASATAGSTPKPHAPTGAIVGGVVGGFALIGFIIAALHWQHNRRPSGEYRYGTKAHQDTPPTIIPFVNDTSSTNRRQLGDGRARESPNEDDSVSYLTSSAPTPTHSEVNATAPTESVRPHSVHVSVRAPAPANRRLTEMSYMRPPSTLPEGFLQHGMDTFSEPGGGETLPAYTPGPS